jgi:hypothetical protein
VKELALCKRRLLPALVELVSGVGTGVAAALPLEAAVTEPVFWRLAGGALELEASPSLAEISRSRRFGFPNSH